MVFKNIQHNEDFNEKFIKKINETINRDIKDTEGYRSVQVFIQGSEHIPPKLEQVPNLMMYYIYNYNHDEQNIFEKLQNIILNSKGYILLKTETAEQED